MVDDPAVPSRLHDERFVNPAKVVGIGIRGSRGSKLLKSRAAPMAANLQFSPWFANFIFMADNLAWLVGPLQAF